MTKKQVGNEVKAKTYKRLEIENFNGGIFSSRDGENWSRMKNITDNYNYDFTFKEKNKKQYRLNILKNIGYILLGFLAIDVFFMLWWGVSGQTPIDNFHLGAVSENIIKAIIK